VKKLRGILKSSDKYYLEDIKGRMATRGYLAIIKPIGKHFVLYC
jgi:hypothetical protein